MSNINPGPNVVTTPNTSFGVVTGTLTQQAGPQTVGTGLTNPNMQATGSVNNYCQVSNQNTSSGVNASSDHIVYPDNIMNDGTGFMDMGICSSGYAQAQYSITGSNDGYVFISSPVGNTAASGDMVFGTDSNGTSNGYRWYTGGFGQVISAYAMKLTSTGLTVSGNTTAAGLTVTAPVASGAATPTIATTIAPTAMISFVSGTTAITTITPPIAFTKGGTNYTYPHRPFYNNSHREYCNRVSCSGFKSVNIIV